MPVSRKNYPECNLKYPHFAVSINEGQENYYKETWFPFWKSNRLRLRSWQSKLSEWYIRFNGIWTKLVCYFLENSRECVADIYDIWVICII